MALVGNCYNITFSEHPTETEVQTWVLPDGTEESQIIPKRVEEIETYENVYLVITQIDNFNFWGINNSIKNFISYYKVFISEEARNNNPSEFLFEGNIGLQDIDLDQPLYYQAYTQIKQIKGFETLIDG